jgi:putative proteasome-type protease
MQTAAKIALGSMLSTAHANLSVGPPYDAAVYRNGSLDVIEIRIEEGNPYLRELNQVWIDQLLDGVRQLPPLPRDVLADFA